MALKRYDGREYDSVKDAVQDRLDGEDYDRGALEEIAKTADNAVLYLANLTQWLFDRKRISEKEIEEILFKGIGL